MRGEDGAEELGGEELVGRADGLVDGGLDKVALGRVVGAAKDELEVLVALGLVNGARELLERGLVDHGAHEVGVVPGDALSELLSLGHQSLLEFGPDRLGNVDARRGAALLALVLKGTADSLDSSVLDISRWVNQVEILAASLAHDPGVRPVSALGNALANGAIELSEHGGAAGVVQSCKLLVLQDRLGNLDGVAGHELDHVLGQARLEKDVVDQPVGRNGKVTGLPDHHVAHEGRSTGQVAGNGREVEGADGIDEALERAVLEAVPHAGRVVLGLLAVQLLGVLHVEAEEVCQLGGGVDLGLPGVFALAEHGGGHDVVAVLAGDQVGGLEKDGGAVCKGERLPCRLCGQRGVDGLGDVGGRGGMV